MRELLHKKVRRRWAVAPKAVVRTDYGTVVVFLEDYPQSEEELRAVAASAIRNLRLGSPGSGKTFLAYSAHCGPAVPCPQKDVMPEDICMVVPVNFDDPQRGRAPGVRRWAQEFIAGMGSIVSLMPTEPYEESEAPEDSFIEEATGGELKDEDIIFADWSRIGHDLMTTLVRRSTPAKHHGKRR